MSRPPRVILVDDEADVLKSLTAILRRRGFDVVAAARPVDALAQMESRPATVVVSDECMPGMSGTEFLCEVRRRHPDTVRIVLSGSLDPRRITDAVNRAGVFRYLLKPCGPDELVLAIEQGVDAHRGQVRSDAPGAPEERWRGEIGLSLQPIYRALDGRLVGHEALLRPAAGSGPDAGAIIEGALRAGHLLSLERIIRAAIACRMQERPAGTVMFVNLHPRALMDPQLYARADPLADHAGDVVLELTERGSLAEIPELRERMAALAALGYRTAIDDLGSGYSGLNALASLQPAYAKFDRDLTGSLHGSVARQKLVGSIAAVCRELGIVTVAEGIEHPNDLDQARRLGCDCVQGFLLGPPGDAFQRGPWLATGRAAAERVRSPPGAGGRQDE